MSVMVETTGAATLDARRMNGSKKYLQLPWRLKTERRIEDAILNCDFCLLIFRQIHFHVPNNSKAISSKYFCTIIT